jgi:GT2 family glycosyltransferase
LLIFKPPPLTLSPVALVSPQAVADMSTRPHVAGKFIFAGNEKLYVRGVTYGPFRPDKHGDEYHDASQLERDFAAMSANGINAVRTYTVPPRRLLDIAQAHGLRVMIGLAWEQHVAFLDNRKRLASIEARVRAGVQACAAHPAVLGYAVGNEIPASIVRWHGPRRVERFIERLYQAAKAEDPEGLVTYVNYPTAEYLQLPFLDLACYNVYLEAQDRLEAYLARLQTIAGDKPLILAEAGLDSQRHGLQRQAQALDWQVRTAFEVGCAGLFVFAYTDEWHRGGQDIEDWSFGVTDRYRRPKPAWHVLRDAYVERPFAADVNWPRMSVVVCCYNGAETLRDCCEGLQELDYPDYEVIVVDDGSRDTTAAIANEHGFRLIRTENRGLSSARNTGLEAATGEVVAYLDSDARPDPHWLRYLAISFRCTNHAAVGGPNLPPADDGLIAACVAHAPGGPVHVLYSDDEAEHIPGCNMAVRKACLRAIGGFDPQFRVAGDDVDVCWRLQQHGWTIGFHPAALVWHHPRASVGAFWKQQIGYGRAEALLERKWPEKYNAAGHVTWAGRLYGNGMYGPGSNGRGPLHAWLPWQRARIFYGTWGSALFQSLYQPATHGPWSLPQMPEWYLLLLALLSLSALGLFWRPLLLALPAFAAAASLTLALAAWNAWHACPPTGGRKGRILVAGLHLLQPLARLWGRLSCGLTLWRRNGPPYVALPRPLVSTMWSERWQAPEERLRALEAALQDEEIVVLRGGDFDRWDLEARAGTFGSLRLRIAVEEHGGGRQLVRCLWWPAAAPGGLVLTLLLAALSVAAALDGAWPAAAIIAVAVVLLVFRTFQDWAAATAGTLHAWRAIAKADAKRI